MGTNYYLETSQGELCSECGRGDKAKRRHIGKSSAGWVFALRVYPDEGIRDLDDWLPLLVRDGATIRTEYDDEVSVRELLLTIVARRHPAGRRHTFDWLIRNHACHGPYYLARAKIDGEHIRGHGRGTWDLHVGEFS